MLFGIYFALLPFLFAFYVVEMRRMRSVRGSRARYVCASLCRVLQYPALLFPLVGLLYHVLDQSFYLLPLDCFTFYFVFLAVRAFRRDDDEDFWSKLKKKLKRAVKSLATSASKLAPSPLPVPHGA